MISDVLIRNDDGIMAEVPSDADDSQDGHSEFILLWFACISAGSTRIPLAFLSIAIVLLLFSCDCEHW